MYIHKNNAKTNTNLTSIHYLNFKHNIDYDNAKILQKQQNHLN